ncbi:MAG TPA: long-chain fatty acid--CoA ligase [Spirochaetota bacterium]|nr:long-chain fatty acid--CoA ligase [Spirochaetota bacterium]HPI88294.1 long-chain fatty acid--CoA ligase [Spirochaetota bacterium]HPR47758.1 long-chain fatty acid--CoA ligase [Spirochaetota bacterium]
MARFQETTMPAIFQNQAEKYGSKACVAYKKDGKYVDISWTDMNTMVRETAYYLLSKGIKKGDKIAIFAENRYEWWIADLASLSIGATDVPIYATNSSDEAQYILENSDSRICFVSTESHLDRIMKAWKKLPKLEEVIVFDKVTINKKNIVPIDKVYSGGSKYKNKAEFDKRLKALKPEDLATLIYTSGTTGNPKGVMLTHHNFVSNVKQSIADFTEFVTDQDTFLSFLPLSHSLERTVGYYLPIHQGSRVAFVVDVSKTLQQNLVEIKPDCMISVPRIYEKLHAGILSKLGDASPVKKALATWAFKTAEMNLPYNCKNIPRKGLFAKRYEFADKLVLSKLKAAIGLDKLKIAISGGGPLAVSDLEFFLGMDLKIYEGFGLTETTPVTNVNRPWEIKPGTVGPALKDTTIKISDEGEILIKGPQVMKGYYKNPQATKEVFTSDGFFKTGDIGVIDEDGYLAITGRIKDIIVTSGGKNISPQNIENSLKTSLYIEQVAVIGDNRKYLAALVVPTFPELQKWAKKNGIAFTGNADLITNPKVLELFDSEIKNNMKGFARVEQIRKFQLLDAEWSQESGELTPSLKVKRRVINDKYTNEIESLYTGSDD